MVRDDRGDLKVPSDFQDVVHDAVDRLLDLLVRDDVYVVQDTDGLL